MLSVLTDGTGSEAGERLSGGGAKDKVAEMSYVFYTVYTIYLSLSGVTRSADRTSKSQHGIYQDIPCPLCTLSDPLGVSF